jgi:glutathione S-transferase
MKLLGSSTSPYVRKCRVAVIELGLSDSVEHLNVPPTSDEISAANPLLKVPTLIRDNGEALFDSRIILRFLNEYVGGPLYPVGHWDVQRRESQAEGLIDAALLLRAEMASRPEDKRWDGWIETQSTKINRALDAMEREAAALGTIDSAVIGTACGLGYLDFRFADWGWRDGRPALTKWFEGFNARPSMQSTMPA